MERVCSLFVCILGLLFGVRKVLVVYIGVSFLMERVLSPCSMGGVAWFLRGLLQPFMCDIFGDFLTWVLFSVDLWDF